MSISRSSSFRSAFGHFLGRGQAKSLFVRLFAFGNCPRGVVRSPLKEFGNEFVRRVKADILHLIGFYRCRKDS